MRSCAALCLMMFALTASVTAQDTVQVYAGWNIIGALSSGPIPTVLQSIPPGIITTSFFGYGPGTGYQSDDTLQKGLGYWVKVNSDGLIVFSGTAPSGDCGTKTVTYAGTTYHTVQVATQCWLLENLNVGTMVTGVTDQTNNGTVERYCYDNKPLNCTLYGALYQWNEAMQYDTTEGAQGICPPGWHIPTIEEFQTLANTVGGDGNALKAVGQGYGVSGAGTNTSDFSALLAGFRTFTDSSFSLLGTATVFWSSTEYDAAYAYRINVQYYVSDIDLVIWNNKVNGESVRCLED